MCRRTVSSATAIALTTVSLLTPAAVAAQEPGVKLAIGDLGLGSGSEIQGLAVAGIGVGAPRITGVAVAGVAAGAEHLRGVAVAPAYFKIERGSSMNGVSVSAFNHVRGTQRGLSIGLLNIADELHGVQVGVINIARNKKSFPVLPILNYSR